MSWLKLIGRLLDKLLPPLVDAAAERLAPSKLPPRPANEPVYWRHAWDPYLPGGVVKRERPVCSVCLQEQTDTNVLAPCYGPIKQPR